MQKPKIFALTSFALSISATLLAGVTALAEPLVFRVLDPVLPGQTALLFGNAIGKGVAAEGIRAPDQPVEPPTQTKGYTGAGFTKLSVLQASDLCAKVALPTDWKPGLYILRLKNGAESSTPIFLNRTEPWWWISTADTAQGRSGEVALPGQDIRVFGKNFGPQMRAWLVSGETRIALQTVKAEKYTATFHLPGNVAAGKYSLWLHNGYGGQYGFGKPLNVAVEQAAPWPEMQYNVRDYGAHGDYVTDDTPAFLSALAKAGQNGGGIVFVPHGQYRITGKLIIPPHTTLRGENRDTVWLMVPKNQPEFDSLIAGNSDFAVEDLSMVAQTARRLVICPDRPDMTARERFFSRADVRAPSGHNVHLARLRMQLLHYAHRLQKDDPRRKEDNGPSTLSLAGDDMWLQDLDIISSGDPFDIHDARHCRVEGCNLGTGRNGSYGFYNLEESLFEGNDIHGVDLEGTYGNVEWTADRLYFARNNWHDAYGDEREALTIDAPYHVYWWGNPTVARGNSLQAAGQQWAPDYLKGRVCVVVNGKGLGQYIRVVGNTADTVTLEHPWDVLPDETSLVSIQTVKTDFVFADNKISDASAACQLYSQCCGFIIDGNEAQRTGGIYGNGWDFDIENPHRRRYSGCFFNQFINNRVSQSFAYEQGGFSNGVIGPRVNLENLDKAANAPHGVMALGNIIRNNQVKDETTLGCFLFGPNMTNRKLYFDYGGRDTIIEDNTISDANIGIQISRYFIDTLVRNNHIERCKTPIVNQGVNTWMHESN